MKRRGFLGFLGGAAAAGPTMARNAIASMPSGLGVSGSAAPWGYASAGTAAQDPSSGDWRIDEISRLKRIISGGKTEEEAEQERVNLMHQREIIISQSTASLVSVSGVSKLRIFNKNMLRLNREIEVARSRSYLKQLMREAGVL